VLASALESRDFGTSRHSRRVTSYATRLTLEVAPNLLDDPSLEWGFLLHDVGKIGIPDGILLKPGRLTAPERRRMQEHAELGERLLAHVPLLNQEGARVIRSHHERWDGNGYPDRLSEESIPLGARIFAVVDSLDAMTDARPYRDRSAGTPRRKRSAAAVATSSTPTSSTVSKPASPTSTACTRPSRSQPEEGQGGRRAAALPHRYSAHVLGVELQATAARARQALQAARGDARRIDRLEERARSRGRVDVERGRRRVCRGWYRTSSRRLACHAG
jgi:Response regulator containing a CheY-like receiver domain and an HD-GYP domain